MLKEDGQVVCLIKPQFEAGREKVGKKGVVRDRQVHEDVIKQIMDFALALGFSLLHLDYSPIKGPEGNIEYLLHLLNRKYFCGSILKHTVCKSSSRSPDIHTGFIF